MFVFTYEHFCMYRRCVLNSYTIVKEDDEPYTFSSIDENSVICSNASIKDIHDKLYRDFFNDSFEFSLFLKYFLNINIEPNSLEKYNSAFITEDYKNRRSDIVYKVKNEPIYLFLEHQSSIDYSMSYRIWEYYNLILRDTVDLNKVKNKDYKLPVIIPILLYTGNLKWDFEPNLKSKQYDNPFKKDILDFEYYFVNIFNYSIEELLNINSMVSYLLATDKCKSRKKLLDVLEKLSNIATDNNRKNSIKRLIIYIYKDLLDDDKRETLFKKIEEGDDVTMKYAWDYVREDIARERQRNINKGIKEGINKGRKEGLLEGIRKNTYEIISRMLENGESIEKIKLYSGYSKEEIEKIKKELNLVT